MLTRQNEAFSTAWVTLILAVAVVVLAFLLIQLAVNLLDNSTTTQTDTISVVTPGQVMSRPWQGDDIRVVSLNWADFTPVSRNNEIMADLLMKNQQRVIMAPNWADYVDSLNWADYPPMTVSVGQEATVPLVRYTGGYSMPAAVEQARDVPLVRYTGGY